jgi:hypothetical protein
MSILKIALFGPPEVSHFDRRLKGDLRGSRGRSQSLLLRFYCSL